MYKLFLCLRYLRLRLIAYLPILAVALCVAMMLIVVSVMNGFLDKIEVAAKGLYGDIVVDPQSLSGIGYYDEFIKEVTDSSSPNYVPEVKAGAPFIYSRGIFNLRGSDDRALVQIAGIRLARWETGPDGRPRLNDFGGRVYTNVSSFGKGLHFQQGVENPTFNPSWDLLFKRAQELQDQTWSYYQKYKSDKDDKSNILGLLLNARALQYAAMDRLANARQYEERVARLKRDIQRATTQPAANHSLEELQDKLNEALDNPVVYPDDQRIILGTMVRSFRTKEGKIVRRVAPGYPVTLVLAPLGRSSGSGIDYTPETWNFTVVDDCRTDVSTIDADTVYLPFETLQRINKMAATYAADNPNELVEPARCSQIHFRVDENLTPSQLEKVADRIQNVMNAFLEKAQYANAMRIGPDGVRPLVDVQTWRTRQAPLVNQIAAQRTLVLIMFGIISSVSVVLIFVIFYMIVFQKTRDIGVIKAVGGSSSGVAGIFLGYGAAVGVVGAIIGTILGIVFVLNINPIHDWVGRTFGLVIWDRTWFMFDQIPNTVRPIEAVLIAFGAILAGLIGALAPAIIAARRQPVEALRYE